MTWLPAVICALLVGGSWGRFVHLAERPQDSKLDQALPVKYVITGQRDTGGHWTEQVKMEHGDEDWHIEVDHMTLEVGEGQPKVKITATFSAKSKTHDAAVVSNEDNSESAEREGDAPVFQLFPRSHRDWFDAQRQCEEWGGHLAVPDTKPKMRELTRILRQHVEDIGETTGAFLGFDDLKREGHFVTVLGKPLFGSQDSTWSPHWFQAGQPDNDKAWTKNGEDCGSFRPNGGLNDVPCGYNLPFICEKAAALTEKAVDEEEATTNKVAAPEDEEDEDTMLQLFHDRHRDFNEARSACIGWGGHLAIPKSGAKMLKMVEMLKSLMESSNVRVAFVGDNEIKKKTTSFIPGNKDYSARSLRGWLRATKFDDDDDDDDEPGWTRIHNDCVVLPVTGGLGVAPCMDHLPYFCEKTSRDADASSTAATSEDPAEQSGDGEQAVLGSRDADASSAAATPEDPAEQSGDGEQAVTDSHEVDTLTLFAMDDLDWFTANDACWELWGGHLAIPDSAEKMEAMTSKMKLANVPAAFLGFSDQEREGHFVTIFGNPVFGESSWSPRWWRDDQPDDDKSWFDDGEDCGSVKVGGGLNDVPCRHHMPFFCEKPSTNVVQASTQESQLTSDESTRESSSSLAPPDDTVDVLGSEDTSSSEEERKFFQILSTIKNNLGNDEIPTAVEISEEVASADEVLTQLIRDIEAILPTLTDSSAQSNDKEESSE